MHGENDRLRTSDRQYGLSLIYMKLWEETKNVLRESIVAYGRGDNARASRRRAGFADESGLQQATKDAACTQTTSRRTRPPLSGVLLSKNPIGKHNIRTTLQPVPHNVVFFSQKEKRLRAFPLSCYQVDGGRPSQTVDSSHPQWPYGRRASEKNSEG